MAATRQGHRKRLSRKTTFSRLSLRGEAVRAADRAFFVKKFFENADVSPFGFFRATELSRSDVRDTCVSSRHFSSRKKAQKNH